MLGHIPSMPEKLPCCIAFRSLDEAVMAVQLKELFPYLSKLVYCQQATVRQALASLLYDRLSPLLFSDAVN